MKGLLSIANILVNSRSMSGNNVDTGSRTLSIDKVYDEFNEDVFHVLSGGYMQLSRIINALIDKQVALPCLAIFRTDDISVHFPM